MTETFPLAPQGRLHNPLWVIGDYPTYKDITNKRVFSSSSWYFLQEQLTAAGLSNLPFFATCVAPKAPPKQDVNNFFRTKTQLDGRTWGDGWVAAECLPWFERIRALISEHRPKAVVLFGELALRAVLKEAGITNWRGSMIELDGTLYLPTFSLTQVYRNHDWLFFQRRDLSRVGYYLSGSLPPKPAENFIVAPDYRTATDTLMALLEKVAEAPLHLSVDIEGRTRITCIGLAWSKEDAMCIPFHAATDSGSYWSQDEEVELVVLLGQLFTHPNVQCSGHNFLYDTYHTTLLWGVNPHLKMDTMQAWHVAFPLLPQSLAMVSSFLLPWYSYWKGEGGGHNPCTEEEFNKYWIYNCKDCVRTFELVGELTTLIEEKGLVSQYEEQRALMRPSFRAMFRGVRQDMTFRKSIATPVFSAIAEYEGVFSQFTEALIGEHTLTKSKTAKPWYRSPTQQAKIFYDIMKLPVQTNRKTKKPTTEDQALTNLSKIEPLFEPLFTALLHYRSLGVFFSTFIQAPIDKDGRFRCSYGVGRAETFRFTSSSNAFGMGGNLQNIPEGSER